MANIRLVLIIFTLLFASIKTLPQKRGGMPPKRETIEILIASRMQEVLNLSDEQTVKAIRILRKLGNLRQQHRTTMEPLMDKLKELLSNPQSTDAQFKALVDQIEKERIQIENTIRTKEAELQTILTPKQKAQFILLRGEIFDTIQKRAMRPRRDEPGRPTEPPDEP